MPSTKDSVLLWEEFLNMLGDMADMKVTFEAGLYGGRRSRIQKLLFGDHELAVQCTVVLDVSAIENLIARKHWTVTRACS